MPVLSPRQSSASALTGSYRSTFSSSTIDRPYFSSTSYNPRITSFSERYTTRTYSDSDGRRIFSRTGSITEDGITTRFRDEARESSISRRDSLSRDSGISSIRENSISDFSRRDSSISRENSRLSAINVLDSVAELRNKYSPANYVPSCLRERNENIARSKSINDIGLPPIEPKLGPKKKVNDSLIYNNSIGVNSNPTNDNMKISDEDDNGNRASVADLRKKFDEKPSRASRSPPIEIEGATKISENRFKKQDKKKKERRESSGRLSDAATANDSSSSAISKLDVNESVVGKNGGKLDEDENGEVRKSTRVNNFASYIPAKDYQKGDVKNGEEFVNGETEQGDESSSDLIGRKFADGASDPRLWDDQSTQFYQEVCWSTPLRRQFGKPGDNGQKAGTADAKTNRKNRSEFGNKNGRKKRAKTTGAKTNKKNRSEFGNEEGDGQKKRRKRAETDGKNKKEARKVNRRRARSGTKKVGKVMRVRKKSVAKERSDRWRSRSEIQRPTDESTNDD